MYKAKVNDDPGRHVEFHSENEFTIDGKKGTWDLVAIGENRFHILKDNRSFTCEVLSVDKKEKVFTIRINGTDYRVQLKDRFDELLEKMGMTNAASQKVNNIKAPMPGLVLKILVEEGQEIQQGDTVAILEAMKMENVIKSPGAGKVKAIMVKIREAVEKNAVLIEMM